MNKIEIYKSTDNKVEIQVNLDNDTVWLTQQQMSILFNQTKQNISLHISNCFREKELTKISVVKESLTTASDGKKYKTKYYNLDVIISIGYRVKSKKGTAFRQWATQRLKDHLVQGYTINQKPFVQRWQQAHWCVFVCLVSGKKQAPFQSQRRAQDKRQWPNRFSIVGGTE